MRFWPPSHDADIVDESVMRQGFTSQVPAMPPTATQPIFIDLTIDITSSCGDETLCTDSIPGRDWKYPCRMEENGACEAAQGYTYPTRRYCDAVLIDLAEEPK